MKKEFDLKFKVMPNNKGCYHYKNGCWTVEDFGFILIGSSVRIGHCTRCDKLVIQPYDATKWKLLEIEEITNNK